MPVSENDLAQLKDHVAAIQQLLLSHILATEIVQEGTAKATIDIVRSQRDAAKNAGRALVAARLNAMIDQIDQGLDF